MRSSCNYHLKVHLVAYPELLITQSSLANAVLDALRFTERQLRNLKLMRTV